MKSQKTTIQRSKFQCARCDLFFFVREQILLMPSARQEARVPIHTRKRCYSVWEDIDIIQAQVSKDGKKILAVGQDE